MKRLAPWVVCLVVGCGGSNIHVGDGGSAGDGGITGDGGGGACASTEQCAAGTVCNPASHVCVTTVTCSTHEQCGAGAYCASSGTCAHSDTGSPCSADTNCSSGEACKGGYCGCGGETYGATSVPPNVLIVEDRSSSMTESITGGTKWQVAKQAIATLLATYGTKIRFGLALFPGTDQACTNNQSCQGGGIFIDVGDNQASQINAFLASANTCTGTPTAEMLTQVVSYAGLKDTTRPNYVLLITDGGSNCADPIPVVTTLMSQTPPVKTFAVGFGESVTPAELNGIAQAGGTAIAGGPPYYYVASDAASLGAAFAAIAGSVVSCTYALSSVPPDVNKLYVYENQVLVPRDTTHTNGWDYDSATNHVTFYGAACTQLQSGAVTDLTIVYGCPLNIG
jgi:hypothetical protein